MLLTLLALAVGLAMDVLAVSLGIGSSGRLNRLQPALRLSFHFGLFQGGMTLLGWLLGEALIGWIAGWDHWLALGLLAVVGSRMVGEGLKPHRVAVAADPTRGKLLVAVCLATSIDALAVGLSLALMGVDVIQAALVIGGVSAAFGLAGLWLGTSLGSRLGPGLEIAGGFLLWLIGIRIVVTHLG